MLETIPLQTFYEWMVYAARYPFGDTRADTQLGMVAAFFANMWRGKKGRRMKGPDFMLRTGKTRPKRQTADQMKCSLMLYAQVHNARLSGGKNA